MPQDGAVEEQSRCTGEIEARKDMHASLGFTLWKRKSCFLKCFWFFGGIIIEISFVFPFSVWGLPWCRFFLCFGGSVMLYSTKELIFCCRLERQCCPLRPAERVVQTTSSSERNIKEIQMEI